MNIYIHTFAASLPSYCKEGKKEYEKRLSRYCKIKYIQYKNEKQAQKALEEFKTLSSDPGKHALIIVSAGHKESDMDSVMLAEFISSQGIQGISNLHFILGFATQNETLPFLTENSISVSRMEIPADFLSLILEEQIYRAYRIINKEPYHK